MNHDECYEAEPERPAVYAFCRNCGRVCEPVFLSGVRFLVCPSCNLVDEPHPPFPEPEPAAPWADFEHVYHEHDERL